MLAEYIKNKSAKSSNCHQFHPSWTLPSSTKSGKL